MIKEGKYTLGELSGILGESTKNEFKAKKGPKVDNENTENNGKAVRDILDATEKFDGGPRKEDKNLPKPAAYDPNKTTLDVRLDYDPGDGWRTRVKNQVEGDNTGMGKGPDGDHVDVETNKKWYKQQKEKNAALNKKGAEIAHSGLAARMFDEKVFEKDTPFKAKAKNESKTMKRLHFKNTMFLSEAQMLSRVPEEYKTDGNVFIMRDASGTDYMVECRVDDTFGFKQLNVLNKVNKQSVNEELNRMRSLYGYNSADTVGSVDKNDMETILENVRKNGQETK